MARKRNETQLQPTKFFQVPEFVTEDGFKILAGDLIKIKGEYGIKFKFQAHVTNTETGATWIDCFETYRGAAGSFRSFHTDRLKRIPQRGKRGKRVS